MATSNLSKETKEWLATRKEEGLLIDPETAEVMWRHTKILDPYGIYPDELDDNVGRTFWARRPGSDIWVEFGDLPDPTTSRLLEKYRPRLMFPAGLLDVDTVVSGTDEERRERDARNEAARKAFGWANRPADDGSTPL
jgi:hypothetical protein